MRQGGTVESGQGGGLAAALGSYTFRKQGVETKVTTRADVERAFAKIVPSRVRNANATWRKTYCTGDANCSNAVNNSDNNAAKQPVPSGEGTAARRARRVAFPCSNLAVVVDVVAEYHAPLRVGFWALGAGVAKSYKSSVLARPRDGSGTAPPTTDAFAWLPSFPTGHCPDAVWQHLAPQQVFEPASGVHPANQDIPPKKDGFVRFVCISDTHGRHREISEHLPAGDILLHAGDFTRAGMTKEVLDFAEWLSALPFSHKVVIAGNHELMFDPCYVEEHGWGDADVARQLVDRFKHACGDSVTYLEDGEITIFGIRIYGSPWQPAFGDWAFNQPRGPISAERWQKIPSGIDVLMTHGPPLGRGDWCKPGQNRAGCADLLAALQGRVRPSFCVFGHIHEGHGASFDGTTAFINASSCDSDYRCINPPLVFDMSIGS